MASLRAQVSCRLPTMPMRSDWHAWSVHGSWLETIHLFVGVGRSHHLLGVQERVRKRIPSLLTKAMKPQVGPAILCQF